MATFQRPYSGFTASDLTSLLAIWPDGKHEHDADGDRLSSVASASRIPGSRSLGIVMEHISAWICQAASMPAADH